MNATQILDHSNFDQIPFFGQNWPFSAMFATFAFDQNIPKPDPGPNICAKFDHI